MSKQKESPSPDEDADSKRRERLLMTELQRRIDEKHFKPFVWGELKAVVTFKAGKISHVKFIDETDHK